MPSSRPVYAVAVVLAGACSRTPARGGEAGSGSAPATTVAKTPGGTAVPSAPTATVTLQGAGGPHTVTVEVVKSPALLEKGLMYRKFMPADHGMLFLMGEVDDHHFWMRNTLIPLDMIFIRQDGTIARIAANTVPLSLEMVLSVEPVVAVLEIPGGRSAELGIRPGDRVEWSGR
jgi:uncharacterized membrane protein (UPF0127 family)